MSFKVFNEILDELVRKGGVCKAKQGYNGMAIGTEFARAEIFFAFFKEKAKESPTSLFCQ